MKIRAPEYNLKTLSELDKDRCLFLAGSITGVGDWQTDIVDFPCVKSRNISGLGTNYDGISDYFHTFNPRREHYDTLIPGVEKEQITWEYFCINHHCANILFWFGKETVAPITLYEYGRALLTFDHSRIWVGVHPEYPRKNDVIIQTNLVNSDLADNIVYSLSSLAEKITLFGRNHFRATIE